MREVHRAQHFGFGQLVGFRFHHHHRVLGAGDDEVEALVGVVAQLVHVVAGRVQDVFAILDSRRGSRRSGP